MKEYFLSIIIPYYNCPDMLEVLLKSIPKRNDIQIIVIDDKSTKNIDKLYDIRKNFSYVFYLQNNEKKGPGTCRNIGIENAKGKWILFADSDDIFLENAFEILDKYYGCEEDIIYFNPCSRKTDGSKSDRTTEFSNFVKNYYEDDNKKNELDLRYRFTTPWSKMIRRSIIGDFRFDEIMNSEDVMFAIKIANKASNIKAVRESIYCVIDHPSSNTAQGDDYSTIERTKVLINRYKYLKSQLSKKDFALLDLAALGRIIITIRNPGSSKKTRLKVINMFLKAHMRILPRRIFTVKFWKDRI